VKCYSDVDDVVLEYMVSILEELGNSAASDDLFDVEQFTEMMEAYLPGFQAVSRSSVIIYSVYDLVPGTGIREITLYILSSLLMVQERMIFIG